MTQVDENTSAVVDPAPAPTGDATASPATGGGVIAKIVALVWGEPLDNGFVAAPRQGPVVRTRRRAAAQGWYAPLHEGAPTTTRQAEILNPAVVAAPLDEQGILIGRTRGASSTPVAHDPFTAYQRKAITSPGVVVLGDIGSGKSSLLKTVYCLRPMILSKRRVVVIDRKDQGGEGEYGALTRRFGAEPLRMLIGSDKQGTRLNPLDPELARYLGPAGQYQLLLAMAERGNGAALDKWERKALRVAYTETMRAAETNGRVPVMNDLVNRLGVIDGVAEWASDVMDGRSREEAVLKGLGVRWLLQEVVSTSLEGLFDGPTSPGVQLNAKLTSFDVSQLPLEGPATAMVMAWSHAWMLGRLRTDRGHGTNFLAEEGWDLVTGPIARQMNANQMLARGLGVSNVVAMHNIAQMPRDSVALSLLKEPQTIHIYRQDRAVDARACVELYGLDPGSEQLLANLPTGSHLLKVGTRPEIAVEHIRSRMEAVLTDTDSAMTLGKATA